ncbi:MAG: hypothetical protein H6605_05570 [Flavobacteriales bacterium]|nr:hypothetical protein [Flavobacteriales bacterium]
MENEKNIIENRKHESAKHRFVLTKHLPFVLFLSFLLVCYIYFTHRIDNKVRNISNLQKEVKDLYSEYITLQTLILNESRSSNLEKVMEAKGIKPPNKPPVIIK